MMNRRDFIAIVLVVLFSVIGFWLINRPQAQGEKVVITLGGSEYGTYLLAENRELLIKTDSGSNTIAVKDGAVYMKDADCPDKYCVHQGAVKNAGDSVICLPHRLVVEVRASDGGDIDAVAR